MREGTPVPRTPPRSATLIAVAASLVASLVSGGAEADIYKRVDEDGVVTFTNIPSRNATLYLKTPKPKKAAAPRPARMRPPSASDIAKGPSRFDPIIRQAAALYQIPEALIRAVIKVESNFNPAALSPANACGLQAV